VITVMVAGTDLGAFKRYDGLLRRRNITVVYTAGTDAKGWQQHLAGAPEFFDKSQSQ
jgi:hypothetical protein